jgi:integrase
LARVTVNKYNIIILDDTVDGKRHRLTTGKKADDRLLSWYKKHSNEEFMKLYEKKFGKMSNNLITFREYGEMVIQITSSNRNEFSQKEEIQRFNTLCRTFGDMDLTNIKPSHIVKWQNECGFAPKTIKNYRGTINLVLHMALCDEIITKNPLKSVKAPSKIYKEIEVFNQDEMTILIDKAHGQLKNILLFTLFSGLRGSELIALRWHDIDFNAETITIDTRIREGVEDVTKSKRVRIIDMLPQAKKALKMQQRLTGLKGDFVFLTQYGTPYVKPSNISESIKALCKQCNIKEGTLQTLRRSCNTLLKQYGMPNDWILDQLGHMDDGVNREHYTGKIKPDMSKIGRVLAELKIG